MNKTYSLKKLFLLLALLPMLGRAQSLADVQCNINLEYTNVTDTVPSMYIFDYDGSTDYIDDGGGDDMYDSGNYLNTDLATDIDYSDDMIIASTDFGPAGQYFTRELPGFFMLAADIDGIDSFYISGGLGADSDGSANELVYTTVVNGDSYDVFCKRVAEAGDPSVNHFIIIPSNSAASHTWATDTDDDQHDLLGISASTRLYYFLVSSYPGVHMTDDQAKGVADAFLRAIYGGNSLVINTTATEVCEGEEVTLTVTGASSFTWDLPVVDGVAFVPPTGESTYVASGVGTNACNNKASVTINTKENPDFSLSTSDVLYATDGSVFLTLNAGIFPFTYDWDNDGTGDFDDTQNLMNVGPGTYTVVVEHGNGCSATASATVNSQVGIESNELETLLVYPNPVSSDFTIKFNGAFTYQLTNVAGQIVMQGNGSDSETISLVHLESGVYMITVLNGSSTNTVQVIKQ